MEQHPIPQQISSYQFRLVGDMTLKQFFQVGGGALVSLIIYATGLHPAIKWPLILLSFSIGAALAFLPFQDRPLQQWVFAFFRSIYSPTAYFWKKSKVFEKFFEEEAPVPQEKGAVVAPHGEVVLEEYLKTLPESKLNFVSSLESAEQNFLWKVTSLFKGGGTPIKPTPQPKQTTPVKKEEKKIQQKPQKLVVPENKPVSIASKGFRPKIIIEEKPIVVKEPEKKDYTQRISPTLKEDSLAGQQAQFSLEAAPPNPPTIPNTVVGQVIDPQGKIVEGAILEITDMAGRPVRALRSNKLGHFMIVTSLQNGQYDIVTEKEGLIFEPISFEAKGDIIPPIAIRAKGFAELQPEKQNTSNKPAVTN